MRNTLYEIIFITAHAIAAVGVAFYSSNVMLGLAATCACWILAPYRNL